MRTPEQLERHAAAQRRYRAAHPERIKPSYSRERHTEAMQNYRHRHPAKSAAHMAVYRAMKAGTVVRQPCFCGSVKSEAHHFMGYEKAHQLDVQWLCRPHHREAHA